MTDGGAFRAHLAHLNFDRPAPEIVRLAARRYTDKDIARRINVALRSGDPLTAELQLVVTERSFTSTTLAEDYAHELMSQEASGDLWEIVVQQPSAVLDINHLIGSMQSHEDEILLPRGAEFKVISLHPRTDGKPGHIVRMELSAKFTTTV